ncbi:hypothetical protein N7495_004113 [Penicillium taxi]|uniref:uncharacterized protein n=1 Tax=Penicillium taxi TaxID=168475 RepID=UPI002545371F|nr:uncharacterized protein N7495_004113 [Penicillium taxi]KAJ5899369.1 hypothetical protein N7495_004113 [Penicillium taxi]
MKTLTYLFDILLMLCIILIQTCEAGKVVAVNGICTLSYLGIAVSETVLFDEAVQILDALNISPSCNRIAADTLMTSCQSIGSKDGVRIEINDVLDRVRSIYAARLAICELDGAFASIPTSCLPVAVASKVPKSRFYFDIFSKPHSRDVNAEDISDKVLQPCLKALESRPQWWTSYSNNRQNAMVLCHAARHEAEKEDILSLHKDITDSSIKLNKGLQAAIQKAAMESQRNEEFADALKVFQDSFLEKASFMELAFGKFEPRISKMLAMTAAVLVSQNAQTLAAMTHSETMKEITTTAELAQALVEKITIDAAQLERLITASRSTFTTMTGIKWGGVASWPTFISIMVALYWRFPNAAAMVLSAFICKYNLLSRFIPSLADI